MTKDRFLAVSVGIAEATIKQAHDNGVDEAVDTLIRLGSLFTTEQLAAIEAIKYG